MTACQSQRPYGRVTLPAAILVVAQWAEASPDPRRDLFTVGTGCPGRGHIRIGFTET